MNLFLDTSVLLAAAGSSPGASREIFRRAPINGWNLLSTPYVIREVAGNLLHMPPSANAEWDILRPSLSLRDDVFTIDLPVVFEAAKDRPILFGALAWSDVLLTLDQADFGGLMDHPFYGLCVRSPGAFLEEQRKAERLK